MTEKGSETLSTSTADFFCDLCKLDFTTKEELREHSWTILHHSKLNKAKGRDCVHECSLCSETFVELLLFTQHLHADSHQDRYRAWKTEQHSNQWLGEPSHSAITGGSSFTWGKIDTQPNPSQSRISGRRRDKYHWNAVCRRPEERPNSKNRNRKQRHPKRDELPFQFNSFPVDSSGMMNNTNDSSKRNFDRNEQDLNRYNFRSTRKSSSSRPDNSTNERPKSWDNYRESNRSNSRQGHENPAKKKAANRSSRKHQSTSWRHSSRRNSQGSTGSFNSIIKCSDMFQELSFSKDRPRSTTPRLGVSTRTCSSESLDFPTGKDESRSNDKDASSSQLVPEKSQNSSGNRMRNLRNRNLFVWTSESFRAPRSGETYPTTSTQEFQGKEKISSEQFTKSFKNVAGRGSNHAIVGKGADERGGCPSTETPGHDNGNPEDSNTEVIHNVPLVNQSKEESSKKVLFVSKRRIRSSNAKGNTEMTMDEVASGSTTKFGSESHSVNHSSGNESNSSVIKTTNDSKTSSRLRLRSSSDDTIVMSRQNLNNVSTKVTQYHPLSCAVAGGALELTSNNSGFHSKEANPTETSTQSESEERSNIVTKIKKELSDHDEKDVGTCTASKIREQDQQKTNHGEKETINLPQCSFIHIDGVRCVAKTSERYCSYHRRFPQGNLIKREQQDDQSSIMSLDLSTTVTQDSSVNEGMSTRPRDAYRYSESGRQDHDAAEHGNSSKDTNVKMMDLSMSTNYLVVSHSHGGSSTNHSSSLYPGLWNQNLRARKVQDLLKPGPWNRTNSNVILPVSASRNSQESFSSRSSPDKAEINTNTESVSPANVHSTRRSPTSPREENMSPSSGASVPTLDLSRLNLPPNVRRALAYKYATKKQVDGVSTVTSVAPNVSTSRNRFIESKIESSPGKGNIETPLEQPSVVPYKPPTAPTALRVRARQQRSMSLDSYPSHMGPLSGSYERSGLVNSHEPFVTSVYDPLRTRSPLHSSGSAFSVPLSKQTTYPEKPKMIDLNNAAYLPAVHPPTIVVQSQKQDKETPVERLGMAGHASVDKEKLMSKLTVPSLRTRMRTMSTERDSAYYKVDPPTTKAILPGTRTERRSSYTERDGRYVMLDSSSLPVTTTLTGTYSQGRTEGTSVLTTKPREAIDFKEGVGLRASESRSPPFTEMSLETRDSKERDATAIALDSHFRQSLNPFERNGEFSKLQEHGLVDLGSSSVGLHRNIVAPRDHQAPSTKSNFLRPIRKESTQVTPSDSGVSFDYMPSKRKANELPEPEASHKRRKGFETATDNNPASYLPGFEVQELLRLEHEEHNKLKSLQQVQEQIKETRFKIQSLSVELENLKAKENQISEEISSTKNNRLEILQFALRRSNSPYDGSTNGSGSVWSCSSSVDSSSLYTNANTNCGHITTSVQSTNYLPTTIAVITHNQELSSHESPMGNCSSAKSADPKNADLDENHGSTTSQSELSKTLTDGSEKINTHDQQMLSQTLDPTVKVKMEVHYEPELRESHFSSAQLAKTSQVVPTISASSTSENSDGRDNTDTNDAPIINNLETPQAETVESNNAVSIPNTETAVKDPGMGSTGVEVPQDKEKWISEHFEKSRKEFLHKIRHQLSTPKKRQQTKKQRKKFSEAKISSSIEVSREKILLVREKIKGWKVQQEGMLESNEPSSCGSDGGPSTSTGQATDIPSTFVVYKDTTLTPSRIPVRDVADDAAKPTEPTTSSSYKTRSKTDTKGKTKLHVVSKKCHSHQAKGQVKKKRKSSHTHKRIDRLGSPDKMKIEEQSKHGSEKPKDTTTDALKSGSESHKAAVESLQQKLQKPNSGLKSLSTSKARASSFEGHTGAVCSMKVYQGRLYTSSADKTTKAFDIQTGECVREYQGHNHSVNCLEILPDEDRLFTGSNDQTVRSYNIKTLVCTHKFTFDGRVMCLHIGFGFLYVGLSTGVVTIVDLTSNTCVERLECHEPRAVSCLATASEGQRSLLCTGSFDATISIRDYMSGLLIKTFKSHTMTVLCMQVAENVLYTGAADCKVLAHNINTGELVRSYNGHTLSVSSLQVVGRVLITSCLDKLIRCYDLMSAELLQAYGGQTDMIFSVHVSNGRIYSGGRDGKVTSVKLDLRVYHPCKWKDCQLNFGVSSHMKDHLRENHVIQSGTIDKCLWADCGKVFAESEGIDTIMDHVLGHVDAKDAPKAKTTGNP